MPIHSERPMRPIQVRARARGDSSDRGSEIAELFDRKYDLVLAHGARREGNGMFPSCERRFADSDPCELPWRKLHTFVAFGPQLHRPGVATFSSHAFYDIRPPKHHEGLYEPDVAERHDPADGHGHP